MKIALIFIMFLFGAGTLQAMSEGPLNEEKLKALSTTYIESQNISDLKIINDNDESFDSKIKAINEAKSTIDMIYYIWSDDYTY